MQRCSLLPSCCEVGVLSLLSPWPATTWGPSALVIALSLQQPLTPKRYVLNCKGLEYFDGTAELQSCEASVLHCLG